MQKEDLGGSEWQITPLGKNNLAPLKWGRENEISPDHLMLPCYFMDCVFLLPLVFSAGLVSDSRVHSLQDYPEIKC